MRGFKFFLFLIKVFVLYVCVGVNWDWGKIGVSVFFCCFLGLFGLSFLFEGFWIGGWGWVEFFLFVDVIVLLLMFNGWGLFMERGVKLENFMLFWCIRVLGMS